jgi:hypothetical protein
MRSKSTNPTKRQQTKLSKNNELKVNNSSKTLDNRGSSLSNYMDLSATNFFITKNKNLLHDYDRYLQVKRERKKGIVFSALKKISYEEKKKVETFNLYNKHPFNDDPRLIMSNYNLLKDFTVEEKTVAKNRILGVDEGLIKLPKLNKDTNYINLFLGHNAYDRLLITAKETKDDNLEKERMLTLNENVLSKNKNIFLSKRNKNPSTLDRGQETFYFYANLENRFKTKSERNMEKIKNLIEARKYKNIEKRKENYENNLIYNYEIKCLDNWDFEHITKTNDLKNDSKFKKFLNDVDNSQMKWIIEIKNDKEQLKLMRRNRHLFDFLTQIDKEQQAMVMQNMSLYKKGFNFDIFNKEEPNDKKEENICKTENNNISDILNEEKVENNNVSQVEFYRQVIKEKKKLEDMFHGEVRTVAEECYITNLNKKKCVIDSFNILQELNGLTKKEENIKQTYNRKVKSLQKRKRKEKKKKVVDNKLGVNMGSLISAKNNNFLSLIKDTKKESTSKNSEDDIQSEKTISKSINFQKQSLFLAEKNALDNEYNEQITELTNQKLQLNENYKKLNKEVKYWDAIHKKEKSKLEQRIKALSTYYYQILKKGIDVRHTGLTWVIVRLLELGAFVDKPHFPSFLNDEQILYLMKIGTKTYELSEFIKLFQILKRKQKSLREKHLNDNIKKEKMNELRNYRKSIKKMKNYVIGNDYMEYIEEIQRKYENVINICLNENKEESNIAKISYDLKQYILQDKTEEEQEQGKNKKLELLFIPGSLSEYFAQDKRFRQYFDDVFYLNDEINKRRDILSKEKQAYLNQYRSKILRGALFGSADNDNKYKRKKSKENEIVYAALFGNGISI